MIELENELAKWSEEFEKERMSKSKESDGVVFERKMVKTEKKGISTGRTGNISLTWRCMT